MNIVCVGVSGWATPPRTLAPLVERLNPMVSRLLPWEALLGDDTALVDAFRPGPTPRVFIGWSLGAMQGLRAMAARSIRPAAAVLIGAAARFVEDDAWPGVERRRVIAMRRKYEREPEVVLRDFAEACRTGDTAPTFVAQVVAASRECDTNAFARGLAFLEAFDVREELAAMDVPSLVLHGESDAIVPFSAGKCLAESLPRGELLPFAAGHALPLLHAARVAEAIREFLRRNGIGTDEV